MNPKTWPVNTLAIKQKKKPLTVNNTQMMNKSCKNYREVGESGTNALNFDHIFKLSWDPDQKREIIEKRYNRSNIEPFLVGPMPANQDLIPNLIISTWKFQLP